MIPRFIIATWLAAVVILSLVGATNFRRLPFYLAFDRQQQRHWLLWMAGAAVGEIATLAWGGFFR